MILAIETSSPRGSVAVWDSSREAVVYEQDFTSDRAHNAVIFEPLQEALKAVASNPRVIVVGTGPGSYSGIRVGIAVANGLSVAFHAEAIGISSLLALPVEEEDYLVIGDARRNSFFMADIEGRSLKGEPLMLETVEFEAALDEAVGAGRTIYTIDPKPPLDREEIQLMTPSSAALAQQAALLPGSRRAELAVKPIEPMYLRGAYITLPKRRSTTVQDSSS